ncbi:hypothetical protein CW357_10565 [Rummeliibacillus sp. TYF005]|uniref:hypothetical protein n=1 Tax=Rummeliibacillus sp. TYF005 TaxID=2058214 RepID=UPI000F530A0A|nr:hypothetical protein [Rummeliibacillus sp. TYF005]RPJ95431.1 hypothetical protein CW357_10565 [Rummeliibacillus sp. TYF005]
MKNLWNLTLIGIIMLAVLFTCTTEEQASAKTIKSAKSYVLNKTYKKATYYSSSTLCGNNHTSTLKYAGIRYSSRFWTCSGQLSGSNSFGFGQRVLDNTYEMGITYTDAFIERLKFPVKKGQVIKENFYGDIYTSKIISTNATVKTKAGKFKNTIVIAQGKWRTYIAKGKGVVLKKEGNKKRLELVKLAKN